MNPIGFCPNQALDAQILGCKQYRKSHASETPQGKKQNDNAKTNLVSRMREAVHHRVKVEHDAITRKTIDSRYKTVSSKQPTNTTDIIGVNYHRGLRS